MHDLHSRSTPDLVALGTSSTGSSGPVRVSSSSRLKKAFNGAHTGALPGFQRSHSASSLPALHRRGSVRAGGLADMSLQLPPGLMQQAEQLVLESSLAGGGLVADAQCHELYGNPESAPDLRSSVAGSGDGPSELSKLADCMSTPFTGDDKNLGELVRAEARAQALRSQLQVSERYVDEIVSQQQEEQAVIEEEQAAAAAAVEESERKSAKDSRISRTRKRRESRDVYEFLSGLGINVEPSDAGWRPDQSGPPANSQDALVLSSIYRSYDDSSNMLSMDQMEGIAPPGHAEDGTATSSNPPEHLFQAQQATFMDHATPSRHPLSV